MAERDATRAAAGAASEPASRWTGPVSSATPDAWADARGLGYGVVALIALYGLVIAWFDALPYQDVPNHLSRAVAIADLLLDGGRRFGDVFTFEWQFVPYILGDVWHVLTLAALPPDAAARLWVFVAFASFPAAAWLLLREWGASPAVRAAAASFAVFLAADWFLLLGFLNFRYALALTLLALVAWERVVGRPTVVRVAAYALLVVAGYLTHLSALVFLVVAVGVLSGLRVLEAPGRLRRYAAAGLPLLVFLGWHVLFRGTAEVGADVQPPVLTKLLRLGGALAPTRDPLNVAIALAFIAAIAVPLGQWLVRSRGRQWPVRAREALALAVAFTAVYLVLPEMKGKVWGLDIRALPHLWLFAAIAMLLAVEARASGARTVRRLGIAALAIGGAHLGTLAAGLAPENDAMRGYRTIAASVPPGARVLTVATRERRGASIPTGHAGSFATVHAGAIVPYTFTGRLGAPVPYFDFRRPPPPHPWQWWYMNRDPDRPAARLFSGYDYLLVQRPADWSRIPVPVAVVRANDEVMLVRVERARGAPP